MTCSIVWFAEHDIDIWLAEELRTNPAFVRKFLSGAGVQADNAPAYQTRVSVMDDAGRETDVEALFRTSSGQTAVVLVESKIKANFQKNQMDDYVDRGYRGIKDGKWASFAVLVFAPAYRNMADAKLPPGVRTLTFEEAASWVKSSNGADDRSSYRASFLEQASKPKTVSIETDPFVVQWWRAVDAMLHEEFDGFFVGERKSIPTGTYVNPRCADMSAYLRLDLKGNLGLVELNFNQCSKQKLESLVESIKPKETVVVNYPAGASLQIGNLEKFRISDGPDIIQTRVRSMYQSGRDLLMFWRSNREIFDGTLIFPTQI